MAPKLTSIILNYRNHEDTLGCLSSLKSSDFGKYMDCIIVDNSSDGGKSAEKIRAKASDIKLIVNEKNLGFAGGNNVGIKEAIKQGSQYLLIINPDVRVEKSFLNPLLKNFSNHNVGIVAPAIIHRQKGKITYGLEGWVDWSLAKPQHRNLTKLRSNLPVESQFVTFACVVISSKTFQKVGFIDDKFFMYFEDVDYCLRAGKKGFRIVLDPSVLVTHKTSSSFKRPTDKLRISFISHLRFISKWVKYPYNLKPILYVILLYPYLYLLWTYHSLKYKR